MFVKACLFNRFIWSLPILLLSCVFLDCNKPSHEFRPEYPQQFQVISDLENHNGSNPPQRLGGILTVATRVEYPDVAVGAQSPSVSAWGPGIVFSRLFRLDNGIGVELPSRIVECDLCSSWNLLNPKTLEVHLRADIHWQNIHPVNGRLIKPEDVVMSLEHLLRVHSEFDDTISNIKKIEPITSGVRIYLKTPDPDILISLANGSAKIFPSEYFTEPEMLSGKFVGTGPWVIDVSDPKSRFEFHANQTYFEKGYPYLDGLRILVIKDDATRLAAFKNGILDVEEFPSDSFQRYLSLHPEIKSSSYVDYGSGMNLFLNTKSFPFSDVRVRKALFFSLDPWRLNQGTGGNSSIVSTGLPLLESGWLLEPEIWESNFNDQVRARQLLVEAKQESHSPVDLFVADFGDSYLRYAERLAQQVENVGFGISITVLNPSDYLTTVWRDREFSIALGPNPPTNTPNTYLWNTLHSQGRWNISGYHEKVLDQLIDKQSGEWNFSLRGNLIKSIQIHMLENAVSFMPATNAHIWAWWPRVQNLRLNFANSEYIFWSRVWLESEVP